MIDRRSLFIVWVLGVGCLSAGPGWADTVRTVGGSVHEGKIRSRSGAGVDIDTPQGRQRIEASDVYEVEEGPGPEEELLALVARVPAEGGLEELEAAVRFALAKGLSSEYRQLVARIHTEVCAGRTPGKPRE